MAPKYSPTSINAILETSEDDSRGTETALDVDISARRLSALHEPSMSPTTRSATDRHREKPRRSHKSSASSAASRHSSKVKVKATSSRRAIATAASRDNATRPRQQRMSSGRSVESSSSSSDDEDDEKIEDHRAVLAAARGRLTSPSLVSTLTSLTTATNTSGSSSGSNSTITQASISRGSMPKPPETMPETPAVPDPPDVFAYLDKDDSPEEDEEEDEKEEEPKEDTEWLPTPSYIPESLPNNGFHPGSGSLSSSTSSSMNSDDGSERAADNDTDRSTSPERSVKGDDNASKPQDPSPTGTAAAKIAAQIQAAQRRQSLHGALHTFGMPQAPRTANPITIYSHPPPPTFSPQQQPHVQHRSPPARPTSRPSLMPVSGYEALASRLSNLESTSLKAGSPPIKPIYRKFTALNHRLLLHLQDELSELEDSLRLLDSADTHSRMTGLSNPYSLPPNFPLSPDKSIQPASRRGHSATSRELEWHRLDLMTKIAFKMNQYNQVLSTFHGVARDLDEPGIQDVDTYREFLGREKLVVESERRFLEVPKGDLVVVGEQRRRKRGNLEQLADGGEKARVSSAGTGSGISEAEKARLLQASPLQFSAYVPTLATMVAAAVLVPILTFAVIPGFVGRITVVLLVAAGIMGVAVQGGLIGSEEVLGREGYLLHCVGIYGIVMAIVASVVG